MDQPKTKAVVTITEMSRMVGLSPARFRQLMGTTFPSPLYSVATRRPFYTEDMQLICLDVRRRNCGIDGRPVLVLLSSWWRGVVPRKPKSIKPVRNDQHGELLDGLKGSRVDDGDFGADCHCDQDALPEWHHGSGSRRGVASRFPPSEATESVG